MPVRRALAAVLALPVLAAVYLSLALRRGPATRIALALGVGGMVVVAAVGVPSGHDRRSRRRRRRPLAASALGPAVATGRGLAVGAASSTSTPRWTPPRWPAAVRVEPAAEVAPRLVGRRPPSLRGAGRAAGARPPSTRSRSGRRARDRDGRALAAPLRAGFLTRAATTATLAVTDRLPSGVALDSSIVDLLRPTGPDRRACCARSASRRPPTASSSSPRTAPTAATRRSPTSSCGSRDELLAGEDPLHRRPRRGARRRRRRGRGGRRRPSSFTTTTAPSVVRFRPRAGTEDVARDVPTSRSASRCRWTAPRRRTPSASR